MVDLWQDLLGCLDLRTDPAGVCAGPNQLLSYHRVFGGQLLAQFVRAAELATPTKSVKSLHVLFPRAGQTAEPIRYEVQCHAQTRTFASLTILARQADGVIATAVVSMHSAEEGYEQQSVPGVGAVLGPEHGIRLDLMPWENRSTTDLDSTVVGPAEFDLWLRTPAVAPELAPALTAYATDLTLIGTALRSVPGVGQRDAGTAFTSAVTSHTVWFHRPSRTDEWRLLRQHSPVLAHGRCFGRGDVLTEEGVLVASFAQEALLRFPANPTR